MWGRGIIGRLCRAETLSENAKESMKKAHEGGEEGLHGEVLAVITRDCADFYANLLTPWTTRTVKTSSS